MGGHYLLGTTCPRRSYVTRDNAAGHVTLDTRQALSRFSACNIEKLGTSLGWHSVDWYGDDPGIFYGGVERN